MTNKSTHAAGYELVQQRLPCDCGVACLAMLARVTYERAIAAFDAAGLRTKHVRRPYASNFRDLAHCAGDIGFPLAMRRFQGWHSMPDAVILKVACIGRPTRNWHWIVAVRDADDIAILDPGFESVQWLTRARRRRPVPCPTGNMLVPASE